MISGIVVARVAGPEVIGTLSFGLSYVSLWSFINGLFSTGHIKSISEGKNLGDCVKTYMYLQVASIITYVVFVFGTYLIQKYILDYKFETNDQEIVIFIFLFVNVINLFYEFYNVTFTATLNQVKANFPLLIKGIVYNIGRIFIVYLGFKSIELAAWNLLVTLFILPIILKFKKEFPVGKFDIQLFKYYLKFVPPIIITVIINNILRYSDKILLAHYANLTEIGYYNAAYSIGGIFILFANSSAQLFFPIFSKLISENDWFNLSLKIEKYISFITVFIFPFIIFLFLISDPFFTFLLSDKYVHSIVPFRILLFATYFTLIGLPFVNLISGMGRFYVISVINIIQLIIYIFSIVLFVSPNFYNLGATGLSINLLLVNAITTFSYIIYVYSILPIKLTIISRGNLIANLIIIFFGLLFLSIIYFLKIFTPFYILLISTFFLILIYIFLYYLNIYKKDKFKWFLEMFNLKNFLIYIKSEK